MLFVFRLAVVCGARRWGGDIQVCFMDTEQNPFTGKPFFNEVTEHLRASVTRLLAVTCVTRAAICVRSSSETFWAVQVFWIRTPCQTLRPVGGGGSYVRRSSVMFEVDLIAGEGHRLIQLLRLSRRLLALGGPADGGGAWS